jgi:F420H(2)-dependent quinone reductase
MMRCGARTNRLWWMSATGQILKLHGRLYKLSDGRVGHHLIGVPTLLLRSTGRRSGAMRTNSLVYARDGDDYLLVPSNGGSEHAPAWLYNLRANPQVEIQIARQRRQGTAKVIEQGEPDFDRLWQAVNENNHDRYSAYQQQTTRAIPIVVVTPT